MGQTNHEMTKNMDDLCDAASKSGRASSKGNQNKWTVQGIWYKADGLGYEALAEVLISRLLEKTNTAFFVRYSYASLERNALFLITAPLCFLISAATTRWTWNCPNVLTESRQSLFPEALTNSLMPAKHCIKAALFRLPLQ